MATNHSQETNRRQINTKTDKVTDKTLESSYTKEQAELRENTNMLLSDLKGSITKKHNLERKKNLSESEIKKIADDIIKFGPVVTSGYNGQPKFFSETIKTLSQEDIGEILFIIAKNGDLHIGYCSDEIKRFGNSQKAKDIFLLLAKRRPDTIFLVYKEIRNYSWAPDVLIVAAKAATVEEITLRMNQSSLNFSNQEKNELLKILEEKRKIFFIAKRLVSRELTTNTDKRKVILGIMNDPALQGVYDVKAEWIKELTALNKSNFAKKYESLLPSSALGKRIHERLFDLAKKTRSQYMDETEASIANSQATVARNLYFQGKEINEQNVKDEVLRIITIREQYSDVTIFSGRNVVLAANSEQKKEDLFGDLNRFGKQALVDRIKADGGNIDGVLRPSDTPESLKDMKQKILESIKNTPPPFPFVFDGHGGEDTLSINGGTPMAASNSIEAINLNAESKITTKELFEAYQIRQENYGSQSASPASRDIFINGGCYSSNFIRNFYKMCDYQNIQKPIFTGETEYGQYALSEYKSVYGNLFFDKIFNRSKTQRATLGNIIDCDSINPNSNPSIYIPTEDNITMQLSQLEKAQDEKSKSA